MGLDRFEKTVIAVGVIIFVCVLAWSRAYAADATLSWSTVIEREDDGNPDTLDVLLDGKVTYDLWGSSNDGVFGKRLTTASTSAIRPNLAPGKACYYVVTVFTPNDLAIPAQVSKPSNTWCTDVPKAVNTLPPKATVISGQLKTP